MSGAAGVQEVMKVPAPVDAAAVVAVTVVAVTVVAVTVVAVTVVRPSWWCRPRWSRH
jgi:hypothetical protein